MKPISVYLEQTVSEIWEEKFAWVPVRSTWSKKLIWLKNYHEYNACYISKLPPLKRTVQFIYTENEYLLMLLRKDETNTL